ncbi:MAG TPA: CAP domain-containing protein [Armatimonadota bacterium]|nr:CAP domain-containing protein [Armatimonadota bacterium]
MVKLSLFLGLLATVSNVTSTTVTTQPPAMYQSFVMTQEELKFVELVNKERAGRGLSQLTIDPLLIEVARKHSREMGDKHYFSHTSPTPGMQTPMDRYLAAENGRPSWALVGENLVYCSIVDIERGHAALMNSQGHRANILEGRYQRIGVGAYVNPRGELYVTQTFLAKAD